MIKNQDGRLLRGLPLSWFSILEIEKIGWVLTDTVFLLGQWKCELLTLLFLSSPNQKISIQHTPHFLPIHRSPTSNKWILE